MLPHIFADDGPDRLPRLDPATYDTEQRAAAEALIASPRGEVRGPFVPLMRSPTLMDRTQRLGEFLRYDCTIAVRLREFAIIVTARIWRQGYEWHVHASLAHEAGVADETIRSLVEGARPDTAPADEQLIYDFCTTLHQTNFIDDDLYQRAIGLLGERGVVELVGLCGYYAMLAMMLNVARTPVPGGEAFAIPG